MLYRLHPVSRLPILTQSVKSPILVRCCSGCPYSVLPTFSGLVPCSFWIDSFLCCIDCILYLVYRSWHNQWSRRSWCAVVLAVPTRLYRCDACFAQAYFASLQVCAPLSHRVGSQLCFRVTFACFSLLITLTLQALMVNDGDTFESHLWLSATLTTPPVWDFLDTFEAVCSHKPTYDIIYVSGVFQ